LDELSRNICGSSMSSSIYRDSEELEKSSESGSVYNQAIDEKNLGNSPNEIKAPNELAGKTQGAVTLANSNSINGSISVEHTLLSDRGEMKSNINGC